MNFNEVENITIPEGNVHIIRDASSNIIYEHISKNTPFYIVNKDKTPAVITILKDSEDAYTKTFEISTDGKNWTELGETSTTGLTYTLDVNKRVYIRSKYDDGFVTNAYRKCNIIRTDQLIEARGNVLSLAYHNFNDKDSVLSTYSFMKLFDHCKLINTQQLLLLVKTLQQGTYTYMFNECDFLLYPPKVIAETLDRTCFAYMFFSCDKLIKPIDLPYKQLGGNACYDSMYNGDRSLTEAPELPATTLTEYCYRTMFNGCESLTETPDLPATKLQTDCYQKMFYRCISLEKTGVIAATGDISLNAKDMFWYCISLKETTWTATTPPTINSNMFYSCPDDMVIYVPDSAVELYKTAAVWSSRAAYIKPISEKQ